MPWSQVSLTHKSLQSHTQIPGQPGIHGSPRSYMCLRSAQLSAHTAGSQGHANLKLHPSDSPSFMGQPGQGAAQGSRVYVPACALNPPRLCAHQPRHFPPPSWCYEHNDWCYGHLQGESSGNLACGELLQSPAGTSSTQPHFSTPHHVTSQQTPTMSSVMSPIWKHPNTHQ